MSQFTPAPVESLESRTLFASAVLAGSTLRIAGDGGASNVIVVANSPDEASIDVTVTSTRPGAQPRTLAKSFAKSLGVSAVAIRSGGGNDSISVGQDNDLLGVVELDLPARVNSGGGDDTIILTDAVDFVVSGAGNDAVDTDGGNDTVYAGLGNDFVIAGDGDDVVRGMVGNDSIDGEDGVDRLAGNTGNDTISGGSGVDVIRGDVGDDTLEGGGDNDVLFGSVGNDVLRGGGGDDALWGGVGDDTLEGGNGNDTLGGIIGRNTLLGGQDADTFTVRDLLLNAGNDFDTTQGDVLDLHPRARGEGPRPPAI